MKYKIKHNDILSPINPLDTKPPRITKKIQELFLKWTLFYEKTGLDAYSEIDEEYCVYDSLKWIIPKLEFEDRYDFVFKSLGIGGFCGGRSDVLDLINDHVPDTVDLGYSSRNSFFTAMESYVGSFFYGFEEWKRGDVILKKYPFRHAAELWRMGLIPIFNSDVWTLHGGKKGRYFLLYDPYDKSWTKPDWRKKNRINND